MKYPAKPDKTRQPLSMQGPVTKLSPIGTNSRSHHELAISLVTNNGPLTRKIRFVTAPTPLVERVTNMKMHQELVTTLVTKWHEFAVGTHDTANRYLTSDYCGTFPTYLCIFTTKHQTLKLRICMHKGSPNRGSLWCKLLVLS